MILFSFQNFTKSSSETSTIFAETSDKKLAENILGHLVHNFYYIDMSVSPKNRQHSYFPYETTLKAVSQQVRKE